MKRVRLVLFGGLLACLPVSASRAEPLTVATYNIENYTLADRQAGGAHRKEYPKPEDEKAALRAVIRRMNADVLALQEVGGEAFLTELQRDLKREGVEYPYGVTMDAGEDKNRMTAVLSKRPLTKVMKHGDLTFKYFDGVIKVKRGLLEVRVSPAGPGDGAQGEAGGGGVALFVVHLKSRYTERADDPAAALQRAAEAVAVRDRVLKVFPEPATARFLILGDFNDNRTSRPVRAILARGDTVISTWLPAADARGEVWTHFFRKEDSYSRVDHVLVSPGLWPQVRGAAGRIEDAAEAGKASDHRPVVAVIE